ncbi:MAG: virulence RhuM family protein [Candidatus Margulisbacteria bacterium]|nr:virulence RhuM family protein [Candidatus Margulisiibacteriota bacterium]
MKPIESQFIMYTSLKGEVKVEVKVEVVFQDETIWLSQKKMAALFNVEVNTINYHLKEIFNSEELEESATIRKIRIVQQEGNREVSREVDFYILDAIIAVGYRVNSYEATQFRIWATNTLKEFMLKGFVLDDDRLKNGTHFGKDYFRDLLERARSIRASERRIYQQITDIFSECSIDYNKDADVTKTFYAMVQNKFHFAITGQTAAEIVHENADAQKPHMGLKTWKRSPNGRVIKSDVTVAKNYLVESDIKKLERLLENETVLKMEDLAKSVGEFLGFNRYDILQDRGKVSQDKFLESDFDKFAKSLIEGSSSYPN